MVLGGHRGAPVPCGQHTVRATCRTEPGERPRPTPPRRSVLVGPHTPAVGALSALLEFLLGLKLGLELPHRAPARQRPTARGSPRVATRPQITTLSRATPTAMITSGGTRTSPGTLRLAR